MTRLKGDKSTPKCQKQFFHWTTLCYSELKRISDTSVALEALSYCINLSYNLKHGYPFRSYGEYSFMSAHSLCILCLSKPSNAKTILLSSLYGSVVYLCSSGIVPDNVLQILQGLSIFIFSGSKLAQQLKVINNKSTGNLSFTTVFLHFVGACLRIYTTFKEHNDKFVLLGFSASALLQFFLLILFLIYPPKKNKKHSE